MAKTVSWKQGLQSILFWSIISAAFIGPGTVATASKAGAGFGLSLLWALVFSTLATVFLQEAAARLTIASGKNLGEIIATKYEGQKIAKIKWMVFLAVAFGCAAYQAGNMLGALSGLALITTIPIKWLTLLIALICGVLLWLGNFRIIANLLGMIVALMGVAFIYAAFNSHFSAKDIFTAAIQPSFPKDSALLIIGLIGTTIVPYNLFLASGISKDQNITEMRIGILMAVLIGGFISIAILLVGTQVEGTFSFAALAEILTEKSGKWMTAFFGFGLFAAGLSSSITSPLAAAVTARSIFGTDSEKWSPRSRNFRLVWGTILLIGLCFGLLDVQPIPAIILAQAINGILLPVVTVFLLLAVNDRSLIGQQYVNTIRLNIPLLLIVGITVFLGVINILKATLKIFSTPLLNEDMIINISMTMAILTLGYLTWKIVKQKH